MNPKKLSHIHKKTLCSWLTAHRRRHNLEVTSPAKKKSSIESLEEENRRLRKELKDVQIEREILKKASQKKLDKVRLGQRVSP